jgi:hypothetical protein
MTEYLLSRQALFSRAVFDVRLVFGSTDKISSF